MTTRELLQLAADLGADFRESLDTRRVGATATADELRAALGSPLPEDPTDPAMVTRELAAAAEPASSRPQAAEDVARTLGAYAGAQSASL